MQSGTLSFISAAYEPTLIKKHLIEDIERNPFAGIGQPEALKHNWSGWWSKSFIASLRGHYEKV